MKNNLFFSFLSDIVFVLHKVSFLVVKPRVLLVKNISEFNETFGYLNAADRILSVNRNLQLTELGLDRLGTGNKNIEKIFKT
ncbi:hypothetical protein [Winogradskyella helgolandensis]|uniref:hypothetical protein n=1 Tax=Winogradskyella helgolandensis TaxID=2697010 RepID=UPI0015C08325|nr:hypothetical protein [Winogradskyella helgolandensis]